MKIRYQLWLIFSILFLGVALAVYFVVSNAYEQRLQRSFEQISIAQGSAILEQLSDTYPESPNRSTGYLRRFGDELDARLIMLNEDIRVFADSFQDLELNTKMNLQVLNLSLSNIPVSSYAKTEFGFIQYTLLGLESEPRGFLLMVTEANGLYDELTSFRNWVMQVLALAVLTFFVVSYFVSSWFTQPIEKIIENLKKITPQKREFSLNYARNDEIKKLIDTTKDMVEQLNLYDERQKRFLSTSSHELKTPLATMQLILENLPHVRENPEDHDEYVQDLYFQVQKMKHMVDQLLQINRIWEAPLNKETLSCIELKEYVYQSFGHLAQDKNLELEFSTECAMVSVDKGLFLRGLDNLISNAIRYSPVGRRIEIKLTEKPKHNKISVCDQGIGIAPENIPHIFEPFYRSNDATLYNQEGTGLGLTIVKQMVDMHKGKIEVVSQPGKGTCVHIILPKI